MRHWMISTATILFDDSRNDLRALPKTVRLQLLTTLSFVWSTAFSLLVIGATTDYFIYGWTGLVVGHIAVLCAVYYTFKQFHNAQYKAKAFTYDFSGYHSHGRGRGYVIYRDKQGNPIKVKLDPNDPGGEHE